MKIEELQFIMGRYDHYYDSVNNKGQFFLGLNTFILSGTGAAFAFLDNKHICNGALYGIMCLIIIAAFVSIFYTLRAILPYLMHGNTESKIYFGSVANFSKDEYRTLIKSATDAEIENDFIEQVHQLAIGLKKKYKFMETAGILILVEFMALVPFLILFIKTL